MLFTPTAQHPVPMHPSSGSLRKTRPSSKCMIQDHTCLQLNAVRRITDFRDCRYLSVATIADRRSGFDLRLLAIIAGKVHLGAPSSLNWKL